MIVTFEINKNYFESLNIKKSDQVSIKLVNNELILIK